MVDDIDDLTPGPGQVLVETMACGICGSDLHTVAHADHMADTAREAGLSTFALRSVARPGDGPRDVGDGPRDRARHGRAFPGDPGRGDAVPHHPGRPRGAGL